MIPREILKNIRQIELRTNRIVTASASRGSARIPTGFRPKAQGCEARATLGHRPHSNTNRNAVAALPFSSAARGICHNPVGVGDDLILFTQGSSCVATLGCMTQSRWDCSNALRLGLRPQPCSVSAVRNFNSLEFEGFRNYGEFVMIKSRAGDVPLVLIPSNSMELQTPTATTFHN
jgi:hypothetical protein